MIDLKYEYKVKLNIKLTADKGNSYSPIFLFHGWYITTNEVQRPTK